MLRSAALTHLTLRRIPRRPCFGTKALILRGEKGVCTQPLCWSCLKLPSLSSNVSSLIPERIGHLLPRERIEHKNGSLQQLGTMGIIVSSSLSKSDVRKNNKKIYWFTKLDKHIGVDASNLIQVHIHKSSVFPKVLIDTYHDKNSIRHLAKSHEEQDNREQYSSFLFLCDTVCSVSGFLSWYKK